MKKFLFISLLSLFCISSSLSFASQTPQQTVDTLKEKLKTTRNQATTLSDMVNYFNTAIALGQQNIQQIQALRETINQQQKTLRTQKYDPFADISWNTFAAYPFYTIRYVVKVVWLKYMVKNNNQQTQADMLMAAKEKELQNLSLRLALQQTQLNQVENAKKELLIETQGSEENYERLLASAEAQLVAFQNFTQIQGGATLLSNQTACDSWGCYYNQRDSQWGNIAINHSGYSIAQYGCLMTSMAMVMTHYGHKITPLDINDNPNNFAPYEPAYLRFSISVSGATAQRVSADIDSILNDNNHDPVIVGISYNGGLYSDHFVVLVSGSSGKYIMNDPFVPNGHNILFTDHYSIRSIREIQKVVL